MRATRKNTVTILFNTRRALNRRVTN